MAMQLEGETAPDAREQQSYNREPEEAGGNPGEQGGEPQDHPIGSKQGVTLRNSLAEAGSAYLHAARNQPVAWQPWGAAAFAAAEQTGKPVLLDVGTLWSHWCHVMDRESYSDPSLASFINQHFVPVKVDGDERPEIDARFQAAVAAISGQSGWPLTVFLTPDGRPFSGGTYFPRADRYGRPGFARVLEGVATAFGHRRAEIEESADGVVALVEQHETYPEAEGELTGVLLARIVEAVLAQFDPRHGGFGSEPKFPHPIALRLLLDTAMRAGPLADRAHEAADATLRRMAAGGLHDQLGGGFHRYSIDPRWAVPRFEKLALDNGELARVYTEAFQSFVEPAFGQLAADTVRWIEVWLGDASAGGFFASVAADPAAAGDGDYYTWMLAEVEAALDPPEVEVVSAFYGLGPVGDLHHDPARNVLRATGDLSALAQRQGRSETDLRAALNTARRKLAAVRDRRPAPPVDRTIYTGAAAVCVSAFFVAGRTLGLPEAIAFAQRSLDLLLQAAAAPEQTLAHVAAYGRGAGEPPAAVLEDYAALGLSCLEGWECTGEPSRLQAAANLADTLLERFEDRERGGFFDVDQNASAEARRGILAARRKPVQDGSTASGNAAAAMLLLRLHAHTGMARYREAARRALACFAGVAEALGLYAAGYALALQLYLSVPVQVFVLGNDERAQGMESMARARFLVHKHVVRLRPGLPDGLPEVLEPTLKAALSALLPAPEGRSVALVCRGTTCLPPVFDPEQLFDLLSAAV